MLKPLVILSPEPIDISMIHTVCNDTGIYPFIGSYDTLEVSQLKHRADTFLVLLPVEFDDESRKLCYFLRDICIDEEKQVYLCGRRAALDEAEKVLPAMIRRPEMEFGGEPGFTQLRYALQKLDASLSSSTDISRKSCLIIDDDQEYTDMLWRALTDYCDVAAAEDIRNEVPRFALEADILIISTELKLDIIDWTIIQGILIKRKKMNRNEAVLLCKDSERQSDVYKFMSSRSICLSKKNDFVKIARYLIRRYFKEEVRVSETFYVAGSGSTFPRLHRK